jgi:hypothetical protein
MISGSWESWKELQAYWTDKGKGNVISVNGGLLGLWYMEL